MSIQMAIFVGRTVETSRKIAVPPNVGDVLELSSDDPQKPKKVIVVLRIWRKVQDDFYQHLDVMCEEADKPAKKGRK